MSNENELNESELKEKEAELRKLLNAERERSEQHNGVVKSLEKQLYELRIKRLGRAGKITRIKQADNCFTCHYMSTEIYFDDESGMYRMKAECLLDGGYEEDYWIDGLIKEMITTVCSRWARESMVIFRELE